MGILLSVDYRDYGVGEHKTGPLGIFMIYPYPATDLFDDKLADGKSQSCALSTFIYFFKTVEYLLLFFQRDTAAGVGDGKERDRIRFFLDLESDNTLCREFGGVDK